VEDHVDEPDPEVVAAARGGSLGAFELLVRRYQADVWRLAFHLLHDQALADDVTQDAFMRAFRFLGRYRGRSRFSTWLFSITRNCAMDELRRQGRRRRAAGRAQAGEPAVSTDTSSGIEVREALAALPMDLREPVVMIDMFGMSYREVASMLRIPQGTVKSRVHRARAALVEALGDRTKGAGGEA
jgi:RNA polymerase sigma-70 factor (ECF subfamily)